MNKPTWDLLRAQQSPRRRGSKHPGSPAAACLLCKPCKAPKQGEPRHPCSTCRRCARFTSIALQAKTALGSLFLFFCASTNSRHPIIIPQLLPPHASGNKAVPLLLVTASPQQRVRDMPEQRAERNQPPALAEARPGDGRCFTGLNSKGRLQQVPWQGVIVILKGDCRWGQSATKI